MQQSAHADLFNNITSPGKFTLFIIGTVIKSLCRLLYIYAVETQYRGRFVADTATRNRNRIPWAEYTNPDMAEPLVKQKSLNITLH